MRLREFLDFARVVLVLQAHELRLLAPQERQERIQARRARLKARSREPARPRQPNRPLTIEQAPEHPHVVGIRDQERLTREVPILAPEQLGQAKQALVVRRGRGFLGVQIHRIASPRGRHDHIRERPLKQRTKPVVTVEDEPLARIGSVRHHRRGHDLVTQSLLAGDHHHRVRLALPLLAVAVRPLLAPLRPHREPVALEAGLPILRRQLAVDEVD